MVGFVLSYRMRKRQSQPVSPVDNLEQRQQRLLIGLAQLDDDFEVGKISEKTIVGRGRREKHR